MRMHVQDKYALRDLRREIELLDRKLNHMQHVELFDTKEMRDSAIKKATQRRETLLTRVQAMVDLGIETIPLRAPVIEQAREVQQPAASLGHAEKTNVESTELKVLGLRVLGESSIAESPLAAWQDDLLAYKRRRSRSRVA